jgi:HEAT repeat protein
MSMPPPTSESCGPSLRERLGDPEENTRAFAAEDAGFDDRAEDIGPLFDRLRQEPSRFVRDAIVTALRRMTADGVALRAVELLTIEDAYLRSAGVTLLQSRGGDAVPWLERAYPSADADVRKFLLDTASGLPGEDAERLLLTGIGDEDVNVCIAAVEYLGERAHPALRHTFEALLLTAREPMLLAALLSALEPVGDASTWAVLDQRFKGPEGFPPFLAPQLLHLKAKWGPARP